MLYDMAILAAMLVCVISYSIYIRSLADFQPQDTYPVYDSLGGAQARLLLPKKQEPSTRNGETPSLTSILHRYHISFAAVLQVGSFTWGLTMCFRFGLTMTSHPQKASSRSRLSKSVLNGVGIAVVCLPKLYYVEPSRALHNLARNTKRI